MSFKLILGENPETRAQSDGSLLIYTSDIQFRVANMRDVWGPKSFSRKIEVPPEAVERAREFYRVPKEAVESYSPSDAAPDLVEIIWRWWEVTSL